MEQCYLVYNRNFEESLRNDHGYVTVSLYDLMEALAQRCRTDTAT